MRRFIEQRDQSGEFASELAHIAIPHFRRDFTHVSFGA